jgi:predicted dehydrogenase
VTAETGNLAEIPSVIGEESRWIGEGWFDVENWASMILTFTDGSRATLFASDAVLGGMQSSLEIYLSNAVLRCNMTLNDQLVAYAPDPGVFADEYLIEKLETKAGWSRPAPDEEQTLGHHEQAQDFVAAVAEGRPAISDGQLGRDVVGVVYAAYLSAEQGGRVALTGMQESGESR